MASNVLLYLGSVIIFVWGIAHLIPTKSVVSGFGRISGDNKKVITLEWIAEGLLLCFLGIIVFLITILNGYQNPVSLNVYRICAGMLIILAILTLATGSRTKIVFFKICPAVKALVAVLYILGSLL